VNVIAGSMKSGVATLPVYVQPRAARNNVRGMYQGCLKIAVTAAPVDNDANKMVTAYLAKLFGVSRSAVRVVAGARGRRKIICFDTLSREALADRLQVIIANES
jgi:uncharacterized protein YggU (UPF0235/DUF167 family)